MQQKQSNELKYLMVYFVCACGYWFWPQTQLHVLVRFGRFGLARAFDLSPLVHTNTLAIQLKQKTGLERIKLHTNWSWFAVVEAPLNKLAETGEGMETL